MKVQNSKIVCYNNREEKGQQMDDRDSLWFVEVRKVDGEWFSIAECPDSSTALAVADALHNFMGCGIAGDEVCMQTQVRMTDGKPESGKHGRK